MPTMRKLCKFLITVLPQKDNIKLKEIENERLLLLLLHVLLSRTYQTIRCKLFHSLKTAITNYSFSFAVKLELEKKINFR